MVAEENDQVNLMGEYTIIISGHGRNQNEHPDDADVLARSLVETLVVGGHDEVKGVFIYGHNALKLHHTLEPGTSVSVGGTVAKKLH